MPSAVTGTKAVTRALRIARTFTNAHPAWSPAALAREGMVVHHDATGAYRLGPAAIELGARARRSNGIASAARPEMETLTRATGETSSIEILSGEETVILDEVQGGHLIGTSPEVGTRWPAHVTGAVVAAISLGGPSTRFTDASMPRSINLVREAAARVSHRLGFVGRSPVPAASLSS
jgi:DNA-binding IclR family transcriptional regulator